MPRNGRRNTMHAGSYQPTPFTSPPDGPAEDA